MKENETDKKKQVIDVLRLTLGNWLILWVDVPHTHHRTDRPTASLPDVRSLWLNSDLLRAMIIIKPRS